MNFDLLIFLGIVKKTGAESVNRHFITHILHFYFDKDLTISLITR